MLPRIASHCSSVRSIDEVTNTFFAQWKYPSERWRNLDHLRHDRVIGCVLDTTCGADEHARRLPPKRVFSDDAFSRAAAIFRVAADVPRLRLLQRLADGEWCVSELAEVAGVGLSTVSQQLRLLRAERIVERRRSGKHTFYSLADRHIIELITNALDHASEEDHGTLKDEVE